MTITKSNNLVTFYETTEKTGDLCLKCTYNPVSETYTVHCWNKNFPENIKTESWKKLGFTPMWGMDEPDYNQSYQLAEKLALEFDKNK